MRRLRSGASLEEIERVYRARWAEFVRLAGAICGDRELGRDAVQDAFAAAVRSRRAYRGDGPVEAWLWRAVVNRARSARREPPGPRPDASSENGYADDAGLRALLAELPERQRLVLFLRYYADLDYRTIAGTLGIAPGTVGATLTAARAALNRLLQEVPR
jgi:RNA polymerase sigma factor (sigma-70 family)